MSDKYTVCPTCGAIGQIGAVCEYCGKAINEDENERSVTFTLSQEVIPKRTISRPELAEKVSVFSRVDEYVGKCAIASVYISSVLYDGRMYGIVNLNGDILFPPEYDKIVLFEQGYAYLQKDDDCFLFDLMKWKRIEGIPQVDWDKPPKDVRVFYHQDYYAIVVLSSYDYCRAFVFDDENRCIFKIEEEIPYKESMSLYRDEGHLPFYFSNEGIILHEPMTFSDGSHYSGIRIQENYSICLTSIFDIRTRKKYAAPQKIRIKRKDKNLNGRIIVTDAEKDTFFYANDGKIGLGVEWRDDYGRDYKFIEKFVELDFSRPAEEVQTIINEAADKLQAINYAEYGITLKKSSTPSTSGSDSSNSGSGSDFWGMVRLMTVIMTILAIITLLIIWATGGMDG